MQLKEILSNAKYNLELEGISYNEDLKGKLQKNYKFI